MILGITHVVARIGALLDLVTIATYIYVQNPALRTHARYDTTLGYGEKTTNLHSRIVYDLKSSVG